MAAFCVEDIFVLTGIGCVITGKVENGLIRVGMKASVGSRSIKISGIEKERKVITEVNEGEMAGIKIEVEELNQEPQEQGGFFKKLFKSSANKDAERYAFLNEYKNMTIEFFE